MECLWWSVWLTTNWGKLRWINYWIIKWKRHRYHWWWKLIALWLTFLVIKAPVIMRSKLLPTLIVPYSTFMATNNTLWMWHDECNMSLWWCCVPVILFFDGQQKLRTKFFAQQLPSWLSFSTRNKIDCELFFSISSLLGSKIWPLPKKAIIVQYINLTLKPKIIRIKTYQYENLVLLLILIYFNWFRNVFLTTIHVPQIEYL